MFTYGKSLVQLTRVIFHNSLITTKHILKIGVFGLLPLHFRQGSANLLTDIQHVHLNDLDRLNEVTVNNFAALGSACIP